MGFGEVLANHKVVALAIVHSKITWLEVHRRQAIPFVHVRRREFPAVAPASTAASVYVRGRLAAKKFCAGRRELVEHFVVRIERRMWEMLSLDKARGRGGRDGGRVCSGSSRDSSNAGVGMVCHVYW